MYILRTPEPREKVRSLLARSASELYLSCVKVKKKIVGLGI